MSGQTRVTLNTVTWGEFIKKLSEFGVTVETLKSPIKLNGGHNHDGKYLLRSHQGKALYVALPCEWSEDSLVGPFRAENFCDRLGVKLRELGMPVVM